MKISMFDLILKIQEELNRHGEKLEVDGQLGPKTLKAMERYDFEVTAEKIPELPGKPLPSPSEKKLPPWLAFALKFKGKREDDKEFSDFMVPQWKLLGLNLGTIKENWAAWCGLAMAVCLAGAGIDYQKNGALAKNWASYGIEINWKQDGIPQGAIVQINHDKCGQSSGNHVAVASGDCMASDLNGKASRIDLYGGNQGNTWKVSTFPASSICAVRWPKDVKDFPKPPPIEKSQKCTSQGKTEDTTR